MHLVSYFECFKGRLSSISGLTASGLLESLLGYSESDRYLLLYCNEPILSTWAPKLISLLEHSGIATEPDIVV